MTLVKSFIPLIIAALVYNLGFLDGVDTFTRLLDSLVIAFIIVASADRLIETLRQLSFSTFSRLSDDKKENNIVTPSPISPTEQREKNNDSVAHVFSTNDNSSINVDKTDITSNKNDISIVNDDNNNVKVSHHNSNDDTINNNNNNNTMSLSPSNNDTSCRDTISQNTMTTVSPSNIDGEQQQEEQEVLTISPLCKPGGLLLRRQRLLQKDDNQDDVLEEQEDYAGEMDALPPLPQQHSISSSSITFSPRPTLSFSTPLRRHTIDEWMPSTPPPVLSPSLSTTSSTTSSTMDNDLLRLRLRRSSHVEEMVKQFDRPGMKKPHHRRYSIGGTIDEKVNKKSYHGTRPYIRNRTFGFKPIIGVWEKRIELEEERMKNS